MPFETPYPYGTAGGFDDPLEPQIPERWRIARQTTMIVYLHVNGVLTEKDRQNVEDVIRVLDLTGVALMAIIVRDDGTIIDNAVSDVNAGGGIQVTLDAPGVVTLYIPVSGIDTAMIADLAITAAKIANDTITSAQLAADSVGNSELAANAVTNTEVATGAAIAQSKLALAITNAEVASGAAIAKNKLASLDIVNADINAAAAIAKSKLASLAIVNADVAVGANIDGSKLLINSVDPNRIIGGLGSSFTFVGQATATWDPPALTGASTYMTDTTITVTGAATGDFVLAQHTSNQVGGVSALARTKVTGWVSAANTVTVKVTIEGSYNADLGSGTLSVLVIRV